MKTSKYVDIEIDALTNSIQNRVSGEVIKTEILDIESSRINLLESSNWAFNWISEIGLKNRNIYGLFIASDRTTLQGLMSLEDKKDHIFIHLIENANTNKSPTKKYLGVAGNLFAFACKYSFEKNYDGFVAFDAKTALIEYYSRSLGATHIGGQRMIIKTSPALDLVTRYFS